VSIKTGIAHTSKIANVVATALWDVVITSSHSHTHNANNDIFNASSQFHTQIQYLDPFFFANSSSKAETCFHKIYHQEFNTS
jgi:hypothetical protein